MPALTLPQEGLASGAASAASASPTPRRQGRLPEQTPATTAGASSTDGGSAGGGSTADRLQAFDDLGLGTSTSTGNFEDVLVE